MAGRCREPVKRVANKIQSIWGQMEMNTLGIVKTASNVIHRERQQTAKRRRRYSRRRRDEKWSECKRDLMVTAMAIVTGALLIMSITTSSVTAHSFKQTATADIWAK